MQGAAAVNPNSNKDLVKSVFWFGLIPNLLFVTLGHFVYMMRPWINVDYLWVAFLAAFIPRRWVIFILALALGNEILGLIGPIYHFPLVDVFRWWRSVFLINWSYSLPLTLLFLCFITVLSIIIVRQGASNSRSARTFWISLALGVLFSASTLTDYNLAYSGTTHSARSFHAVAIAGEDIVTSPLTESDSATGALLAQARSKTGLPNTQIAVIVVESLGVFKDAVTQGLMLEPLLSPEISRRYQVEGGMIPFHGHTIDGELRELCGVRLEAYGDEKFPKCLPSYLKEQGYETVGLHGFTGQFYNRFNWYPKLGFDRIYFSEDMYRLGVRNLCGSGFVGICDTSVAEMMHDELLRSPKNGHKFVYWMTLNSHLPLDPESSKSSTFDCEKAEQTRLSKRACLNTRMIHLVLSTIAQIALDPKLPATEFIITGDHMPPFASARTRGFYSASEVPYLVLKPR
jgi:hypothetical protein